MNDKIKQLALDAGIGFTLWDDSGRAMIDNYTPEEHLAEFAELIIGECLKQVEPTQHHQVWAQSYLGGVDGLDLLSSKIKDIKKHFGVEE